MNFLFVNPKYANRGQLYQFPLGLAYVSSYMRYKGFNVFCLNTCHCDDPVEQQVAEHINNKQIDVICTGGMSASFNPINAILETAKKIKPEIITVAGGPIVTSDPRMALQNMPIDFGVIKEGEETMADLADALCNGRDVNKVKGLTFLDTKNNLITTEPRAPISDLDVLPFPDYEGFEYGYFVTTFAPNTHLLYYTLLDEVRPVNIVASRSCPFSCTFCYHPLGKKYRQRSLDNVFKEIDYLVEKYNINVMTLMDELFSVDKKRMYEFARGIEKYNIKWVLQLRVSDVDEEVLQTLKKSGAYLISYGIESLSNKILKSMQKGTTKTQIERALKLTREAKIAVQGNIIFGDPEETEETVKESMDWWLAHPEYGVNLNMLNVLPDSPVYRYAVANGFIKDKFQYMKDIFPPLNLTKLSDARFKELRDFVANYGEDKRYVILGKVREKRKYRSHHNGEKLFSIKVECSQCGGVSEYRNMREAVTDPRFLVICRNCHMRLRIKSAFNPYKSLIKTVRFWVNKHPSVKRVLVKVRNKYRLFYSHRR